MAIDPTKAGLFAGIDWLIGNHSDELTPWIPVMAARYVTTVSTYLVRCVLNIHQCSLSLRQIIVLV